MNDDDGETYCGDTFRTFQYRIPRMDDDARAVLCCDVSPVDCEFGMEIGVAVH